MGFSKYLDNIEDKMTTISEEVKVVAPVKIKRPKRVIKKTVNETTEISEDSLKTRMICELNRFGLNSEAIDEIMVNVFHAGNNVVVRSKKPTNTFAESTKKVKPKVKKSPKYDPIERASSILDGGSPMIAETLQQGQVETEMVSPQKDMFNGLDMGSTAEHASALL